MNARDPRAQIEAMFADIAPPVPDSGRIIARGRRIRFRDNLVKTSGSLVAALALLVPLAALSGIGTNGGKAEGYQNAGSSCSDRVVLVDQATDEIAPLDLGYALDRVDVVAAPRRPKSESTMRSLRVVVASVVSKNAVQVPATEDRVEAR